MNDQTYIFLHSDQTHCPCCGNLMLSYGNYTPDQIKKEYEHAEKVRLKLQSKGVPVISKEESDRQVAHKTRVRFGKIVTIREMTEEEFLQVSRRRIVEQKSQFEEEIKLRSEWIARIERELQNVK